MNPFTPPRNFSSNGVSSDARSSDRAGEPEGSPARLWACWCALAATFALFVAASFLPDKRLWGVNHLAFFSHQIRIIVLCVTAVFFVPPLATRLWRALLWILRPFFRGLENGANAIALSGVISLVVFAVFRSSTKLLGDGYFITTNYTIAAGQGMGIGQYFELVTLKERIYPLTELLNYAASWTAGRFGASPAGGVWILNCVIGAAVVVGLLAVIRRTGWPDSAKLLFLGFVLFTGAIELFFGYIEHYTPAIALGALYVLTAVRAVTGSGRLVAPGLVLLAGTLFHVQSVLLAPSYLWLVVWSAGFKRNPARGGPLAVAVGVLTVTVAAGTLLLPALQRFFLSLTGGDGVLSGAHLIDVANEVLLLNPAWLLLAVVAIWPSRRSGAAAGPSARSSTAAFGWCLAVPAGLFLLLFKTELGMARDWDLYCFALFGLAAPGLFALSRATTGRAGLPASIAAPAVALCAALVISWVGVNADAERSVARYRAVLSYDLTNPGYAYENLARHFEDNYQYTRQVAALRLAYDTSRNPRFLHKLGRVYFRQNDLASAREVLRAYLEAAPEDDEARKLFLGILARTKSVDEMIEVSRAGIEHSPRVPDYYFFLGNAYLASGKKEEGFKAFEACSRLNPPPEMVQEMQRLTEQAKRTQSDPR